MLLKNVKIMSYNVISLKSMIKKDNIESLINQYRPDLLFLQETHVNILTQPLLDFVEFMKNNGYLYFDFNPGEFGTGFFSKIKPLTWELLSPFNQGRIITVTFSDVFIIAVYGQNAGKELKRLDKKLEWTKYISNLVRPNTLFLGDLNVVHKDIDIWAKEPRDIKRLQKEPGMSPVERLDFEELVERFKFVDLYRFKNPNTRVYTFYSMIDGSLPRFWNGTSNKGWRLDYFMYNGDIKKENVKVEHLKYQGSDHLPIMLTYSYNPVFKQVLGSVKTKIINDTLVFRQTDSSSDDKPMHKMFEHADYNRHCIYIAMQNAPKSYQFMSFKNKDAFESFYAKQSVKCFYEIIRGRCKMYFDLDNVKDVKPFLKTLHLHLDYQSDDIAIKRSSNGFHVIVNKWYASNEDIKELEWINKIGCDTKVYTKNRMMRLLHSTKFGHNDPFEVINLRGKIIKNIEASSLFISLI